MFTNPQFTVLNTSSPAKLRLGLRRCPPSRLQLRMLSYSTIPSSVARAYRVPIAVVAVSAGVYWYASYKFEQLRKGTIGWVQDTATNIINSASDGIKSVSAQASTIKPTNIETPKALKDLARVASDESTRRQVEELGKKTTGWLQSAGTSIVSSASDGIKSVSVSASTVKTPKFLKDLFPYSGKPESDK